MKPDEKIRIGTLVLNRADHSLQNDAGTLVRLRPQSLDVLSHLASRPGQVVTKDELMAAVWPDSVVTDASIAQCIKDIRRVLGDNDRKHLETVPRRGYRLLGTSVQSKNELAQRPVVLLEEFSSLGYDPRSSATAILAGAVSYLSRYSEFTVQLSGRSLQPKTNISVDLVIGGSVEVRGNRIRAHVQMADGANGQCLCSEKFEQTGPDLFESHDHIARSIAATFGYRIANSPQPFDRLHPTSASNLHLPSRQIIMRKTEADLEVGETMNRSAIEKNPNSALGHIGLAFVYRERFDQNWGPLDPEQNLELAVEHSEIALQLDPLDYYAHLCRGAVHRSQREVDSAILRYRRALELNPTAPNVRLNLGNCLVSRGDVVEALELISETVEMAPIDAEWRFVSQAVALWANQRYEDALETMAIMANPVPLFLPYLAVFEASSDKISAAQKTISRYLEVYPNQTVETFRAEVIFQDPTLRERWIEMLRLAGLPGVDAS